MQLLKSYPNMMVTFTFFTLLLVLVKHGDCKRLGLNHQMKREIQKIQTSGFGKSGWVVLNGGFTVYDITAFS